MKERALIPKDGRKSFYGKAIVRTDSAGNETLISYGTPVLRRTPSGDLIRLWGGWTATTGRHIRAFAGLSKSEFMALE